MVGNAKPDRLVHGVGYAGFNPQRVTVARGQTFETRDAGVTVPGAQAQRIEMVDAVRDAEPLHQGCETDAARYDEDRRSPSGQWLISFACLPAFNGLVEV